MTSSGYVVFDCDIGNDDAWALLMLIKGEEIFQKLAQQATKKPPKDTTTSLEGGKEADIADRQGPGAYKILGVTCVQGNTDVDNGVKNALRVLESVDRLDIPVYRGCANPILPRTWKRDRYFQGRDGFGDVPNLPEVTNVKVQSEHAVNAMYSFVCKYPKMVDFILVGPLSNFAMCINMYGADFLDKVRDIYIMGGNYRGKGNITKSAEFNFMMDPEAAHIVLESVKKNIILVPWETCIDGEQNLDMDWRINVLGKLNSKAMQLMNTVEYAFLLPYDYKKWIICDAVLVAVYLFPQLTISKSRVYHCTVELTGTHTRGQMVLDHKNKDSGNSHVIMAVHSDNYKQIILWTGGLLENNEMEKLLEIQKFINATKCVIEEK